MDNSLNEINLADIVFYSEVKEEEEKEENKTEQAYLEMADQYKEIMEKKNELIKDLKKSLMVLYGIIRLADENHDYEMVVQARQAVSEFIDKFIFLEEDEV